MAKPSRKSRSDATTAANATPNLSRGWRRAYLGLGSNLGNRVANIRRALEKLSAAEVKIHRISSLYETEPVDYLAQPWFVNCVAEVDTQLAPQQLLKACKAVERALGRRPSIPKGPREIDIDILFYENVVVRSATFRIPHARLEERRFVLVPLCELAPELHHPVSGRTAAEMLAETQDKAEVLRMKQGASSEPKTRSR